MRTRQLGTHGPTVSEIGLGCMSMSGSYGASDEDESLATIEAALAAGINLLDTGDFYAMGDNELLIGAALRRHRRDEVVLSVKFGALRTPDGRFLGHDARPRAAWNFLAYSLRRLGTEHLDVYRPARLDPAVPIEETVGALGEMVDAGYVRYIGLSEIGVDTLRRACAVRPICDLQIEYSLLSRGIEAEILPACRELGVAITAYGVLSRGLLSGHWQPDRAGAPGDGRRHFPRFAPEHVETNLALVEALRHVAAERGVSVAEIATAWVAAQGEDIVPLVGARRREQLAESLRALEVVLEADDLAAIEEAVPQGAASGTRYGEQQMGHLDSERRTGQGN